MRRLVPAALATTVLAAVGARADEALAAAAAPAVHIDSGSTAWVLFSAALVFLMTAPGLALFYGGLVRRKNILSILMQCMMAMFLVSLQWVLVGYSLAFGSDKAGIIGGLEWLGLRGVSHVLPHFDPATGLSYAATIPHQAFMVFQMMFAAITPALIIGAFAERMRFGAYCLFILLWATLVYDPVAHWIWGTGGFLGIMRPGGSGAIDFAGGLVVHTNAGVAALACALFLGKRRGYPQRLSPPHNLPLAMVGAGLLWFGWFGFNAGSALSAGGLAVSAFVVTHLAGAVGGLTWAGMDWVFNRKPTMLGVITGAVSGLATVTPASGFVNIWGALAIGVLAGSVPWLFVMVLKPRLGYDDSLDAFGVHGIGGILGSLAVGLFAVAGINGKQGLLAGDWAQLLYQGKAVLIVAVYSFVLTLVILKVVDLIAGLRANEQEESIGLDLTEHREVAYTLID